MRCNYFGLRLTRCFFIQIFLRIQLKIHAILRDCSLIITKGWGGGVELVFSTKKLNKKRTPYKFAVLKK